MNKKRITAVLLTLVLALALAFAFAACTDDTLPPAAQEGTFRILLAPASGEADVYTVDIAKLERKGESSVYDALVYLVDNEGLEMTGTSSAEYGYMISTVGKLTPDSSKGEWISILTSVDRYQDKESVYAVNREYDGVTVWSSTVGVSSHRVEKDCVIYITILTM